MLNHVPVLCPSLWLWWPAHWCHPPAPCPLLGTGPVSEPDMAELVGIPHFGAEGRNRAVNRVAVQFSFCTLTLLCSPGLHVQSPGTGQCPGGQLASRVCLNNLMENMEGAGTRTPWLCLKVWMESVTSKLTCLSVLNPDRIRPWLGPGPPPSLSWEPRVGCGVVGGVGRSGSCL